MAAENQFGKPDMLSAKQADAVRSALESVVSSNGAGHCIDRDVMFFKILEYTVVCQSQGSSATKRPILSEQVDAAAQMEGALDCCERLLQACCPQTYHHSSSRVQ